MHYALAVKDAATQLLRDLVLSFLKACPSPNIWQLLHLQVEAQIVQVALSKLVDDVFIHSYFNFFVVIK